MTAPAQAVRLASPADQFRRYGGTAFGLLTGERLAEHHSALWVAPFAVAALAETGPGDRPPAEMVGHKVIVKPSGPGEAFSPGARRGSHGAFPRPTLDAATTWHDLAARMGEHLPGDALALVVQGVVTADGWPEPVIAHADGLEVRIEYGLPASNVRSLVRWTPDGAMEHHSTAGTGRAPAWCEPVARLHHDLVRDLGFPLNTEGVVSNDGRYGLVQLRPLPHDAPVDPVLTRELADLVRRRALVRETPFVWGVFDVTVDGAALAGGDSRVAPATSAPGRQAVAHPDENPPVLVDLRGGFHLSHAPDHLPPPGPARDRFRYIGLPGLTAETVAGRRIRLLSDGRTGGLVVD